MSPQLRHALDAAYEAFAHYEAPDYLGISNSLQLRDFAINGWYQLTDKHDMGVLMFSDDGELLRYFLPRWLEWLSDGATSFNSSEWQWWDLGYRLAHAKWQNWPADEVATLRSVFGVLTREEIAHHNGAPPAPWLHRSNNLGEEGKLLGLAEFSVASELLELLCTIGDAPLYLEFWLDTNLPQLARWLWLENLPSHKGARDWITSSRLENRLETAFFNNPDGEHAELFSRSIELIRSLRAL